MNNNAQTLSSNGIDWFGALTRNPEGLLLVAAGCALMLRQGSSRTSSRQSGGAAGSGGLSQATDRAMQYASDIAEQTRQTASSYASTAAEYAEQTRRAVGEQSERLVRQAQSTTQSTMNRILQDQPLIIAMAGLAAGAAVAATFPATEIEQQNLGPVGERVTEAAHRVGDQLKEATMQAGETLKDAAVERGLTAEGLKEVASEVAGAFTGSMSGKPESSSKGSTSQGSSPQGSSPGSSQGTQGQPAFKSQGSPQGAAKSNFSDR